MWPSKSETAEAPSRASVMFAAGLHVPLPTCGSAALTKNAAQSAQATAHKTILIFRCIDNPLRLAIPHPDFARHAVQIWHRGPITWRDGPVRFLQIRLGSGIERRMNAWRHLHFV